MQKILCLILASFLSFFASATEFQQDVSYAVIGSNVSAKPEVVKYFSYFCPHCASMEGPYSKLAESFPNATFTRIHVPWLGGQKGPLLQRAHATAVEMQVEALITRQIFTAFFDSTPRRIPQSAEDVRAIFVSAGISGEGFDKTFNSPAVDARVAHYNAMTKALDIERTPSIVVNRKYKINMGAVSSEEELHALVRHLLTLK